MEVAILTQDNHFLINESTRHLVVGLKRLGLDVVVFRTSATPKGRKISKFNVLKEMHAFAGTGFVIQALAQYGVSKLVNTDKKLRRISRVVDIPDIQKLTPDYFRKNCRDTEVLLILSGTRIIKQDVLDIWRHGVLNVHSSLLPYSKGLMPALWTFSQNRGMGVTLFRLNEKIDDGQIILQIPIAKRPASYLSHLRLTKAIAVNLFLAWAITDLLKGEVPIKIEETYNKYPDANFSLENDL